MNEVNKKRINICIKTNCLLNLKKCIYKKLLLISNNKWKIVSELKLFLYYCKRLI